MRNSTITRLIAAISLPVGLLATTISSRPAFASNFDNFNEERFDRCLVQMLKSRISERDAGAACADALNPEELSTCVRKIEIGTPVVPQEALKACFRVRRPEDLANCVVDIHDGIKDRDKEIDTTTLIENSSLALDYCRRSVLPARYSKCVLALNFEFTDAEPSEAMETCISAEDFPRQLFPELSEE